MKCDTMFFITLTWKVLNMRASHHYLFWKIASLKYFANAGKHLIENNWTGVPLHSLQALCKQIWSKNKFRCRYCSQYLATHKKDYFLELIPMATSGLKWSLHENQLKYLLSDKKHTLCFVSHKDRQIRKKEGKIKRRWYFLKWWNNRS